MKLLIIQQLKNYRDLLEQELYLRENKKPFFDCDSENLNELYVRCLKRDIKDIENLIGKVWECEINEKL